MEIHVLVRSSSSFLAQGDGDGDDGDRQIRIWVHRPLALSEDGTEEMALRRGGGGAAGFG